MYPLHSFVILTKNKAMRVLVVFFLIISARGFAQLLPNLTYDQGWSASPNLTDEFNTGTTYNSAKWTWKPGYTGVNGVTCFQNDANNISVQSGYARLAIQEENCSCTTDAGQSVNLNYSSGNLVGLSEQQYGYFEVRFRISDIPSLPGTLEGISANAWLWRDWVTFNCVWSEIDLSEIEAVDHRQTCNVIYDANECDSVYFPWPVNEMKAIPSQYNMRCQNDPCTPVGDFNLSSGWHIYSAVWNPNGIAIYVDGVLINRTTLGCPGMEPLNWRIGPSTGEYQFTTTITEETQLPFYMDVDYARVYHLNMDCNTTINVGSFYFTGHDDKVKNSITIGGSGYSNTQPTSGAGSKVFLRAVDFVLLNGEFTVPVGAELTIESLGECF
jgi:beta-glucanase (GH16 family)